MPGFQIHNHGNDVPDPVAFPLDPSEVYRHGDPVFLDAGEQLLASPHDGTEVLDTELVGFAAQGALGEQSATRTGLAYGGGPGGNATDTMRGVYPATPALLIRTRNFWAAGAAGTQQAKTGALRGKFFQISSTNVATADLSVWGVENTAGVIDTDAVAHIVDVLDDNMQSIAAATTLTAGQGWLVFRIVGNNQWAGGVATVATA